MEAMTDRGCGIYVRPVHSRESCCTRGKLLQGVCPRSSHKRAVEVAREVCGSITVSKEGAERH